jgi:ribosome biogenesis GTPase A
LLKVISISDIILEVLDARFFDEMRDMEMEEMIKIKAKKIIYVLIIDLVQQEKIPKAKLEQIITLRFCFLYKTQRNKRIKRLK